MKDNLKVGDKVKTNMGCYQEGVIVKPFPQHLANDGTFYPFDSKRHHAVEWTDGTKGFHAKQYVVKLDS